MSVSSAISPDQLDLVHRNFIQSSTEAELLLERVRDLRIPLYRGMNKDILPESAHLVKIDDERMFFETQNFAATGRSQIFLRFTIDGFRYLLSASRSGAEDVSPLTLTKPITLHREDRRDRVRTSASGQLALSFGLGESECEAAGELVDTGPGGVGVSLPSGIQISAGVQVRITGHAEGSGVVRTVGSEADGWRRVGIQLGVSTALVSVERRSTILERSRIARLAAKARVAAGAAVSQVAKVANRSAIEPNVVRFKNSDGEEIVGIVDGATTGPVDVGIVVPPAWGRTKETLLPLARTVVESFGRNGIGAVVLRFDGIRKRGESHCDPEFQGSYEDQRGFTFSQGVRDLETASAWLRKRYRPRKIALVSFSASSVEARRFIADNPGEVDGWVSVVGTADVQSMMRVISGGVDYLGGVERGASFGVQEILGVSVDIDRAAKDALDESLAFFEDSSRDFQKIACPIRWIRGEHDAWMDRDRVLRALSIGRVQDRRVIEVPTGHQLRSSGEALDVFQLITQLVGDMLTGVKIRPSLPSIPRLAAQGGSERGRVRRQKTQPLGEFWERYLLGASGGLGIALLNQTSSYRMMMDEQVNALDLSPDSVVLDLGAGSGALERFLSSDPRGQGVTLVAADLVAGALAAARDNSGGLEVLPAQLDLDAAPYLPLADSSVDSCLCSLVLSYLTSPNAVLGEIRRVLKPGGVVVVSAMKPDADISQIYQKGLVEIAQGGFDHLAGSESRESLAESARLFLNDAARLMDLEEEGVFRFWNAAELRRAVAAAGLRVGTSATTLGDPPQAFMVVATRP